ncbi:MAG: nitrogen regulation protein NR(II) [Oceanospirillales bacterium]|uniref:Sensory histidine kinase/phosphatase NtrB n=1 Tax=Marinobacterium halophilum TaxID=267374 RepID=A0A2P8ETH4_9GAMM|nr:nitrogen regulation protein NR(II) [Marinobacterium halophilum]MBR9829202.1 nitrogen regulation protein NR(II) [Oceanospirillales bacterium]PSL12738.1 two-component system nitrogen regulation sensor histidine kinase GlnL [Marinobacterium halophilum]
MAYSQSHKQILDNLTGAVMVLDAALCIQYMNPAAEMLLEATVRRLKSRPIEDWLSSSENELAVLRQSLASGHPYSKREARLLTQTGQELIVDYSVSPIPDAGILLEIQARDRLIRIEREEELLTRHASARVLVRGLAHEIKNPLGGIRGAAQLLDRELDREELHEYTRVIIDEADRLRHLVDRLLGPHKLPVIEPVNIHAILEHVCSLVTAEMGGRIRIIRDYDPSIPEFNGARGQLIQAVLNIIRNAMQALEEAETSAPCITLRTRALRQITLGAERHRLVCNLEIIDNGPGIPDEISDTLFYPMVSSRAQGSGLGLSIAQSIMNQHKGLIEFTSEPGCTRFNLFIPLELGHDTSC